MNKLFFGDNLTIEGPILGMERAGHVDLSLGRAMFKQAAVEEMGAEHWKIFDPAP